jgi:HEAT repeat protein
MLLSRCPKISCQKRAESYDKGTTAFCLLLIVFCLLPAPRALAQQAAAQSRATPNLGERQASEETPLPGDWAAELLDGILSSPNQEAQDALYRAAFAAGPSLVPQLAAALEDDRTAEFAAQVLAFIGGEKATQILWKLQEDKRDLNLRRFYYGALGEFDAPQATDTLFDVINKSDAEPDRSVTEAAILALTVRSDPRLLPRLREAESKIQDVVIHDDLDNALAVIEERSKYLASPEGKKVGGSVEAAVRTYFIAGLEPPPPLRQPTGRSESKMPAPKSPPSRQAPKPPVSVEIRYLTLSPDKTRALARVTFEDPSAIAEYDVVLQKRFGDWTVASVWLGSETEKPEPILPKTPARKQ